jgi:hypothetical protein
VQRLLSLPYQSCCTAGCTRLRHPYPDPDGIVADCNGRTRRCCHCQDRFGQDNWIRVAWDDVRCSLPSLPLSRPRKDAVITRLLASQHASRVSLGGLPRGMALITRMFASSSWDPPFRSNTLTMHSVAFDDVTLGTTLKAHCTKKVIYQLRRPTNRAGARPHPRIGMPDRSRIQQSGQSLRLASSVRLRRGAARRTDPIVPRRHGLCGGAVRVFRQKLTLEDAVGSHACLLEALPCV